MFFKRKTVFIADKAKKKKGLSHEPARISMWRRFSALVYAATVFLKVFFFFLRYRFPVISVNAV